MALNIYINININSIVYCKRVIIICFAACVLIFDPIFQCGLLSREVNITDNLCTKKGNVGLNPRFIIKSGFKSRTGNNGASMVVENTGEYYNSFIFSI